MKTQKTIKNYDLYRLFVSKDHKNPALTGIYYDATEKAAVACDSMRMIVIPSLYDEAKAGQVINKDAVNVLSANPTLHYPKWKSIMPKYPGNNEIKIGEKVFMKLLAITKLPKDVKKDWAFGLRTTKGDIIELSTWMADAITYFASIEGDFRAIAADEAANKKMLYFVGSKAEMVIMPTIGKPAIGLNYEDGNGQVQVLDALNEEKDKLMNAAQEGVKNNLFGAESSKCKSIIRQAAAMQVFVELFKNKDTTVEETKPVADASPETPESCGESEPVKDEIKTVTEKEAPKNEPKSDKCCKATPAEGRYWLKRQGKKLSLTEIANDKEGLYRLYILKPCNKLYIRDNDCAGIVSGEQAAKYIQMRIDGFKSFEKSEGRENAIRYLREKYQIREKRKNIVFELEYTPSKSTKKGLLRRISDTFRRVAAIF